MAKPPRSYRELPRPALAVMYASGLALVGSAVLTPAEGPIPFISILTLVVLAGLVYLAWHVDPAWTLTAALVLSIFGGNWQLLGFPGRIPVPPDRLLLLAGILALLLRAPGVGVRPRIRLQPIHWLLVVALLFAVCSALISGTLFTNSGFFRLFDRFGIAPFAMFLLGPIAFRTEAQRRILLGGLVTLGAYLGLTALFETVGPQVLVFPKYILNPEFGIHFGRARGPFLEAEANGIALYFCGVAAAVACAVWRHRPGIRFFAAAVVVLSTMGCLFTLQRGVWLGTGLATIVTMLAFRELRRFLIPATAVLAAVVIASFTFIPGLSSKVVQRAGEQQSLWDRSNLNAAALRMVEARPVLGFGWGRFPDASPPYFRQDANIPLTAVGPQPCTETIFATARTSGGGTPACTQVSHNSYLSNASELGLVGTALWGLSLLMAVGGAIVRRGPPELLPWRVGLLAVAVMWATVIYFTPLEGPFSPVVLFTWAGIVWGAQYTAAGASKSVTSAISSQ